MQANSGDTKGLVNEDWTTINWEKIQLLQKMIDLSPWYGIPSAVSGNFAIESSGSTSTSVATLPFTLPLRGITWNLSALEEGPNKINGDFATVLQRTLALGFDTIVIPFGFNDLESDEYLGDLRHDCTPINETALRQSVLATNVSALTVTAVGLPVINGVTRNISSPVCNDFDAGTYGKERLIYLVRALLQTGVRVVLQNTDAYAAQISPNLWLLSWVDLAGDLQTNLGNLTDTLVLDLINTINSPMQWNSVSDRPGLSELYRTALPALYPLLPTSSYLVQGVNGSDFITGEFFFKNLLTEPWAFQVVPFAFNDPFNTLTNLTESLDYVQSPGICLTADKCQSLQYVVQIPFVSENYTMEQTGILSSDSWILGQDPSYITPDGVQPFNALGLRPWYYPRSAYSRIVVPQITPGTSVESAQFTDSACTAVVTVSNFDAESSFPTNAVLNVQFTNLQATTLFPPWQADFVDPSITGLVHTFDGTELISKSGQISISYDEYYTVLWPAAINSVNTTLILEVLPPVLTNLTVSTNNLICSTTVILLS